MEKNTFYNSDYSGGFSNIPTPPIPPSPPPPPPFQSPGDSGYSGARVFNEQTIYMMTKNMKFVAIFTIVMGVFECLSCIGAAIGIPLIFAGIRLKESAEFFLSYAASKSNDENALFNAFEKQSRYFYIYKILFIIGIVFLILYIIGIIIFLFLIPSSKRFYNF